MRRDRLAFAAQGFGLVGAVALAILGPQPGRAVRLVPVTPSAMDQPARALSQWASHEDAQLLSFDAQTHSATAIAPSGASLMRALSYGLIPIASDTPTCTANDNGQPAQRPLA